MDTKDLYRAVEIAKKHLLETGAELKDSFGKVEHTDKDGDDAAASVVTELDRKTEQYMKKRLEAFSQQIGFKGEEFGSKGDPSNTWLMDPIDGTAHFIRGIPLCSSMLCLIINDQVVATLIHDFVRSDMYWAIKGEGAFKNDQPIKVSDRTIDKGYVGYEIDTSKGDNLNLFKQLRDRVICMATINCGIDFAWIASGKMEGRIMKDPWGNDWDFAPGSLLVSEAGGAVTNIGSKDYDYRNFDYLALNKEVYKSLVLSDDPLFPIEK